MWLRHVVWGGLGGGRQRQGEEWGKSVIMSTIKKVNGKSIFFKCSLLKSEKMYLKR